MNRKIISNAVNLFFCAGIIFDNSLALAETAPTDEVEVFLNSFVEDETSVVTTTEFPFGKPRAPHCRTNADCPNDETCYRRVFGHFTTSLMCWRD